MNNILAEACLLSEEMIADGFPETGEQHEFSDEYKRRMNRLYSRMRGNRYHRTTKATFSLLVAAALIATLTIGAFAYAPLRHYIISVFDDHTSVDFGEDNLSTVSMDIQFGYFPNDLELSKRTIDGELCDVNSKGESGMISEYWFKGSSGQWLNVSKMVTRGIIDIDTEDYQLETLLYENTLYTVSRSSDNYYGVYWSIGGVTYNMGGNLPREELMKIAYNMK